MRRTRAACCARAASGHAAAPLSSDMNPHRGTPGPQATAGAFAGKTVPGASQPEMS